MNPEVEAMPIQFVLYDFLKRERDDTTERREKRGSDRDTRYEIREK